MRPAIDKSVGLDPIPIDRRTSYSRKAASWDNGAVFYDWGVDRNIHFGGFSTGGNSRFVDSLFAK